MSETDSRMLLRYLVFNHDTLAAAGPLGGLVGGFSQLSDAVDYAMKQTGSWGCAGSVEDAETGECAWSINHSPVRNEHGIITHWKAPGVPEEIKELQRRRAAVIATRTD